MESTLSVSKGVFVFKNKLKSFKESTTTRKKGKKKSANVNVFCDEPWYNSYLDLWKSIERKIQILRNEMSSSISNELMHFINGGYGRGKVAEIPTAALLTGVNMPDHTVQFKALVRKMKQNSNLHIASLYSEDGPSIKSFVENMINQFVNGTGYSSDEEDELEEDEPKLKIKKVNYNFSGLKKWYDENGENSLLVVILPDFESFNEKVLHDFILIVSSYINILPFVFVFGIATSLSILHKMLPYHVSSKINIQFFNSQPSRFYLNSILENIMFTDDCPFHMGGNVFNLFTDVFLFYDLSVTGFIQKCKYAMLEHFSYGNVMTLCSKSRKPSSIVKNFDEDDCENARRLLSFRTLVEKESPKNQIKLLTDDSYFKEVLKEEVEKNLKYLNTFHLFLKCLHLLTSGLPQHPLGKQLRELYSVATSKNITKTNEYRECFQLLQFQSRLEFTEKITQICELIENEIPRSKLNRSNLQKHVDDIYDILEGDDESEPEQSVTEKDELAANLSMMKLGDNKNRNQFRKELLGNVNAKKQVVEKFETAKAKLLSLMSHLFQTYLYEPTRNYFYEIFFFYDTSLENQLIGTQRAALHTALNDPHNYLQCDCCELPNDAAILKTMPDVCIAYKLHLEYGKMINLFDWLQAFTAIINPVNIDEDEDKEICPLIHARFTQAVAELEFLGFIKSSKRKTDHVQRLTWGG